MPATLRHHASCWTTAKGLALVLFVLLHAAASAQTPTWNWALTQDAGSTEYVRDIAIEPVTGNIYVVGAYRTTTGSAVPFGLPATVNNSEDAFLAKLDPNGAPLWRHGIGSVKDDAAMGVAVSSTGLVVITGYSGDEIPAINLPYLGNSDAFIAAFDASGNWQWTRQVAGSKREEGTGVVISGAAVVAYGNFEHNASLIGISTTIGLSGGKRYAYLNAYSLTGTLQWSITGVSDNDILTERIAADASNVYVVGSTAGTTMSWRSSLGNNLFGAIAPNDDALFASAVSLSGVPVWIQMIDNPGDSDAECNGVAVHCSGVYITGHSHNSSVFPGGITRTMAGVHDYWFLASLSTTTGSTNWVRTASSSNSHGADGYDVSVGRNGQIHVAGMASHTLTTDGGTVINGGSDNDICIARFNNDGTAVWYTREASPGDEWPLAITTVGNGNVITGGWYEDGLTLGSNTYPGTNGTDLFTASFTDPVWSSVSNNPARFAQPGPFCSGTAPVDLNNNLVAYAASVVSSSNVSSPQDAVGAPNGSGAIFNTMSGWEVLDLGDTLFAGEAVALSWRSELNLFQARMLVSSSLDGVTWSAASTYNTTSGSFTNTNYPIPANARFIKVQRHSSGLLVGFHLDALRYLGGTFTGGVWSGGAYITSAGIFTPGAAGSYPVTYTLAAGGCSYTYSRSIEVLPAPVGGSIAGGGTFCPGATGTLTLSGHSGPIVRWERSANGTTWLPMTETSSTLSWAGITGTMHFRVVIDGGVCGSSTSSVATVTVQDIVPPMATCPPALTTLYVSSADCTVAYRVPLIAVTDNCLPTAPRGIKIVSVGNVLAANGTAVALDEAADLSGGTALLLGPGTHAFTDTISDVSGNSVVCNWQVNVLDTISPVITCPATVELPAGASCKAEVRDMSGMSITATDNCTNPPIIGQDLAIGSQVQAGDVIRITATDSAGNAAFCPMTVVIIDNDPPVFDNCPGPGAISVTTDPNSCEHRYNFPTIESTDNCDGDTESDHRTFILEAGNTLWQDVTGQTDHAFPPGLHQLMEIHGDDRGNRDTCLWSLDVVDGNAPSITCPNLIAQLNVGVNCTVALPDYTSSATANGNCSGNAGLVITQSPVAGTLRGPGSYTITLTATQAGQSVSCSFVVSIVDNTPPSFNNCPTNITVNAASNACSASVTWNPPMVSDNCTGATISQTAGQAPGSTFAVGTHIITYTALDAANNPATCSFIITVNDNTDPTFTMCPSDIAVDAPAGACGAVVNYTIPTATDNCGTVTISRNAGPASGSTFPVGTTQVRHRATDGAGRTSECSFWVTVFDVTAPSLAGCANISVNSSSSACSAVVNYTAPTATEACTTCPPVGTPSGYTALGTYQGRTYFYRNTNSNWLTANNAAIAVGGHLAVIRDAAHNAWLRSAVDAAGGTGQNFWIGLNDVTTEGAWRWTNSASIGFLNWDSGASEPNSQGGNEDYAHVKSNGKWNDEKSSTSMRSVIEVEANCITPVLTSAAGTGPGSTFLVGTTAVSYKSTDPAGNTSTCTFNVVVTDVTAPSFGAIPGMLGFVPANSCTITAPNYPTPADNCPGVTVEFVSGPNPGAALAPGSYSMGFRARDAAGLYSAAQTMNITVQDTVKPTITGCPTNFTVSTTPDLCTGVASWTAPGVTDNCTGAVITQTAGPANNSAIDVGTYTVTYTATDASSNSQICSFSISVVDNEPAEITCPNDTTLYPDPGTCVATFAYDAPVITDNCGGPWSALFVGGLPSGDFPIGTTTTQYTGSVAGQTLNCEFTVTVLDVEPPSVYCPLYDSLQYFLNANCELAWPNLLDSISVSDCSSVTPIMWPPADTIITQAGVYAMTMDFIDAHGNLRENNHLIWVKDTIRPSISCPVNITVNADAGTCGAVVNYVAPVGTDNCGGATTIRTAGPASGSLFPIGATTVTHQVTDAAGVQASCSFTVTVTDNIAPSISGCPANISVTALPGACDATASWTAPSVGDNCPGATIAQTAGPASGSNFPIGTTTITYTASDGVNTSTCSFEVIVQAPAVDLAYAVTSICQGSAPILPSIASPAGGVFSDANQNGTINPSTGAFDPSVAAPGLHTLGYVFAGACTGHDWFTIQVVAAPSATITYAGSPFCSNETVATMTRTGTAGGTFTATPSLGGLSTTTGHVDLTAASAGTYTVTYSVPASGACPAFSTTTALTIEQAPNATISYAGPYCTNTGPQVVSLSGPVGGSFTSSSSGLTLNSSTGQIVPGSSACTSTGTSYSVTYMIPATSACPAYSTSASVTITQAPWAGTNGSLSICSNAAPVNLFGSLNGNPGNSGSWTNPVNAAHSGVYDPAIDGPGAYTYTMAGGPGCAAHSAAVQVTESTMPAATIAYGNTPYCNLGTASVTRTGAAGGTYSAGTGLVINASTGAVNLASSTPGSYTVTYSIAATSVCPAFLTSAPITINPTPNAGADNSTTICNSLTSFNLNTLLSAGVPSGGTWKKTGNITVPGGTFNPSFYATGGTYMFWYRLAGAAPCPLDSAIMNITITPSITNTTSASACNSYTWSVNGQTYTTSGSYSAVVGCVTEVLSLTITPSSTNTTGASACNSYTWSVNGQTYTTSGSYSAVVGCATEVLSLTITPSSTNTTSASACDSYTWSVNGQTYTTSGSYSAVVGCVTEVLNLTISNPGTFCDDGNTNTGNDMLDASCNCIGQLIDCAGVINGTASMDACGVCSGGTTGLIANASCTDCLGVVNGTNILGSACNDNNPSTENDTWNAGCQCIGTPINFDCAGVANGTASVDACGVCSGGTTGLIANASCTDCLGVVNGTNILGSACDDNNPSTENDTWNAGCQCIGTPINFDCAGVANGTASVDACGVCSGGTTGIT
ncbi:MAG: HYR domain-containing protein, partial [Flavobacteriales bacterium]|nr:HYR domain-containing protein [Flavobacteriales bacterium]